ncbi:MAG: hypothetical protein CTY18_05860 [Methylomonas sp.]|nr:MAG: hypothetical protein CTY24_15040 [Methylobacter sp.]PPD36000.1 MAG: hypothetical protein CTY18_05860 [Methylomonas sp.]
MTTPIYVAILGLIYIGLSINVIKSRRTFSAGLGDADNIEMLRRIRAQANCAEYAPIFLILLGYAELGGLPGWAVHLCGLAFLAGRIMHAYSLLKAERYENFKLMANPVWRITGMIFTLNVIGALALIILFQSVA